MCWRAAAKRIVNPLFVVPRVTSFSMVTLKLCRCAVLLLPQAFALERLEPSLHESVVPPSDPFGLKFMMERVTYFAKTCLTQVTISLARMVPGGPQETM